METKEEKYIRARERVYELRKFYRGLISYVIIVSLLAGLNYYLNEWRSPWFLWVAGFWGLGLVIEAGKVYGLHLFFGKSWESRKIEEMMKREEDQSRNSDRWE